MSTPSNRFTVDGSEALESALAAVCASVLQGIRAAVPERQLEAVLLGGGYGRGEGGVLRTTDGDRPYNDLEFYVMVRGQALLGEKRHAPKLAELGHRLSPGAGLEVEFKVMTLSKLRGSSPNMFYYDLVAGHRLLLGNGDLLVGCEHHRDPARIPLHEATRLLMNRCSGLLFSAERLRRTQFDDEDADFVGRNLAKAQLALGDVALTALGQYHWSCRTRQQRLGTAAAQVSEPWMDAVVTHHQTGVQFKLHPIRSAETREQLAARHRSIAALALQIWLWLESRRFGRKFESAKDYAFSQQNLCPETPAWKNLLLNWRTFKSRFASGGGALRYPRERLLRALALLLWSADDLGAVASSAANLLGTDARDFTGLVRAYQRIWERYN